MSLASQLSPAERANLGPKTCQYLNLPHEYANAYRLGWLVCYVLAEREKDATPLPDAWQAGTLALLLGNIIDHAKAKRITPERADQYRAEARTATRPGVLLRLLVKLHFETQPTP